jgi:hypothetical protein
MTDVFDRFERQLTAAGRRLGAPNVKRPRHRATKPALAALTLFLFGGVALAATQPWQPDGITHSRFAPPPISGDSPPANELQMLSVLRRRTTQQDRSTAVDHLAGYSGSPSSTTGVRTNFIRRVGTTSAGAPIVLVPLRNWTPDPSMTKPDALCLIYPEPGDKGAGKGCWTAQEVHSGKAFASLGSHVFGLVPDGVASIAVLTPSGPVGTASVHDNVFDANVQHSTTPGGVATVAWLDAQGNSAGP